MIPQKAAGCGVVASGRVKLKNLVEIILEWLRPRQEFRTHSCFPGDNSVPGEGITLPAPMEGTWPGLADRLYCGPDGIAFPL